MSEPLIDEARDREAEIAKEMRTCRYFNGINHDECQADVNYRALVGGSDFGWALAIPCLSGLFRNKTDRALVTCEKFSAPTEEEATASVDERRAHVTDVLRRIEAGETNIPGVRMCGQRTAPEGKQCPDSVDGKCSLCGAPVDGIYGLGSGYGGVGGYSYCTNEECGEIHDFREDTGE